MKFKICFCLLMMMLLSACSNSNNQIDDGTYVFQYIEYYENNETKRIDCSNLDILDEKKKTTCQMVDLTITIDDNYYTFSMTEGHLDTGYYKLDGDKIEVSQYEDGEYKYTGWMHYRDGKIYYGINNVYVVLDN